MPYIGPLSWLNTLLNISSGVFFGYQNNYVFVKQTRNTCYLLKGLLLHFGGKILAEKHVILLITAEDKRPK